MPLNDGNKYQGKVGTIKMDVEGGTADALAHVQAFTIEDQAADVDFSELNEEYTDGDIGQRTLSLTATVHRSKGTPLIRPGKYEMEFQYDDSATTPGTIAGTFRVLRVSSPFQLNNSVAYQIQGQNCGAVTITPPTA